MREEGSGKCVILPILFSVFMTLGEVFARHGNWDMAFLSGEGTVFTVIQMAAWFFLFYFMVNGLYSFFDKVSFTKGSIEQEEGKVSGISRVYFHYMRFLYKRPVLTVILTMMVMKIPYMLCSYPGIFMGDTQTQLYYALGVCNYSSHHPVAHTFLLQLFMQLVPALDWNGAFFCYSMVQMLFFFLAAALVIKTLIESRVNHKIVAGILLYYLVNPMLTSYLFLVSKDVIYASFFVLFYVFFHRSLEGHDRKNEGLLILALTGMILFRNEGKYIVSGTFIAALLLQKYRKRAFRNLFITVLLCVVMSYVVYPCFNVQKGSVAEMLSIPFQQTARYVKEAQEDITEEEAEVIGEVLDYKSLGERYDANISDPVKETYSKEDSKLPAYFKVWFQMMWKHPSIYAQSFISNYYQYFYVGNYFMQLPSYSRSSVLMEDTNGRLGTEVFYPQVRDGLRERYAELLEDISSLPIISFMRMPGIYIWICLLCLFYVIRKRSLTAFVFCMPVLLHILVLITGPTNGYYGRYEFPMFIYLPMVVIFTIKFCQEKEKNNEKGMEETVCDGYDGLPGDSGTWHRSENGGGGGPEECGGLH